MVQACGALQEATPPLNLELSPWLPRIPARGLNPSHDKHKRPQMHAAATGPGHGRDNMWAAAAAGAAAAPAAAAARAHTQGLPSSACGVNHAATLVSSAAADVASSAAGAGTCAALPGTP
jgi:hypothetical protein